MTINRAIALRLGLNVSQIDNAPYDAFGQRSVSTIDNALNQYRVIMEVTQQYWQDPEVLNHVWISTSGGLPSGYTTTNASSGTVTAASTAAASATGNGINNSQRNAAQNAIAASGSSVASSRAAVRTVTERYCRPAWWCGSRAGTRRCR